MIYTKHPKCLYSTEYITNLASYFGVLSQTILRILICEETFVALVGSPLLQRAGAQTCLSWFPDT